MDTLLYSVNRRFTGCFSIQTYRFSSANTSLQCGKSIFSSGIFNLAPTEGSSSWSCYPKDVKVTFVDEAKGIINFDENVGFSGLMIETPVSHRAYQISFEFK